MQRIQLKPTILSLAILALASAASGQWVAYNDHSPGTIGTQTHNNATIYNVRGTAYTNTGYLKNIANGTNLPVTLAFTLGGAPSYGGTAGVPNAGTPLATNFDGYVYYGNSTDSAIQVNNTAFVTNTFTGLDPSKRYSFRGGAVRGGADTYANRWAKATLVGAVTYSNAHSAGAITSAQFPADLQANEAAICTGINLVGDVWDWEDIDPGEDGSFAVICTQYRGAIPGGGATDGTYGYAISGIRLEEKASSGPIQFTVGPQGQIVVVGDPFSMSVQVRGALPYFYQWYRGTTLLTGATNATFSVLSAVTTDAGYYYVIASNLISRATSSTAQIIITNGFPIAITNQPQSITVPLNETAVFTVGVSGTRPQYQWFRNSVAIPDATNATLLFTNVQATNQGNTFFVRVWNMNNTNTSSTVTLSVITNKQVLFVVNAPPSPSDVAISNIIASRNLAVVVQDDNTSATIQTNNKVLVMISSSVDPTVVATKFRDVRVPVITWESSLFHAMLLTTTNGNPTWQGTLPGQRALSIYDTNHPLAAGLRGTNLVYKTPQAFNYGVVGGNGYVVATATNETGQPVLFGYESNAFAANGVSITLGRRVGLFLEDNAGTNLTAAGTNLILAAITWATNRPSTDPLGFSRQPVNLTAAEGNTATFSCIVTGAVRYYFQWQRNNTNIPGAIGRTYTTPALMEAVDNGATFRVIVTNTLMQRITSSIVNLTVTGPLPIVLSNTLPADLAVGVGQSASFTVNIISGGLPRIQWYKDGIPIANATNVTFSIANTTLGDAGHYWAIVTNRVSSAESRHAGLAVMPPNQIIMPDTKSWRYYTNGYNTPAPLAPIAWYATNFNDSAWPQGNGVLGFPANENILGFTFGTLLPRYMEGTEAIIRTFYFRTYFNFTNDPVGVQIIVSNVLDDGAVFYLNGVEVSRIHVPSGNVNFNTRADRANDISDAAHGIETFTLSPYQLLPGTNVLAVEVHQGGDDSSDMIFGQKIALIYLTPTELIITNQPDSLTVQEAKAATFTVGVTGAGARYQWYHDGVAIPGETKDFLTLPSVTMMDAGQYSVSVSNAFTYLMSSNATLTVLIDTNPPTMVTADGTLSQTLISLTFSEDVVMSTATNRNNYVISNITAGNRLVISSIVVGNSGSNVLFTTSARVAGANYVIFANNVQDTSPQHNVILPNSACPVSSVIQVVSATSVYQYYDPFYDSYWGGPDNPNIGTNWHDANFVTNWPDTTMSAGAFYQTYLELPAPKGKTLSSTEAVIAYFLGKFNYSASRIGARLQLRHLTDDGNVIWLNGQELFRYNMPEGPINFDTRASSRVVNGALSWSDWSEVPASSLRVGTNAVAVELHSFAPLEVYRCFAMELQATILSYAYGPVLITTHPQSQTVPEGAPVTFSFVSVGASAAQWYQNGQPIPGATNETYTIAKTTMAMNDYTFYVVANNASNSATSVTASLNVIQDLTPPTLISAIASSNIVTVTFSEPMDPQTTTNRFNYTITAPGLPNVSITSAVLVNGSNVVLQVGAINGNYILTVNNVRDGSESRNLIATNSQMTVGMQLIIPFNELWRYNSAGNDLGTSWRNWGFIEDATWASGRGVFYNETAAIPGPTNTWLVLSNGTGPQVLTYYFRLKFNSPMGSTNAELSLRYQLDDGMILYLNATDLNSGEITRGTNMPNGTIYYTNLARAAVDNATLNGPYKFTLNNLLAGTNVFAAEVHQNSATSSDIVFGAELIITIPSVVPPPNQPPTVQITSPVDGAVYTAPVNITLAADAADSDGTVQSVQFFAGTNSLGVRSSPPFTFTWINAPVGSHILTARATDNLGATGVSEPITINVMAESCGAAPTLNVEKTPYPRIWWLGRNFELRRTHALSNSFNATVWTPLMIGNSQSNSYTIPATNRPCFYHLRCTLQQ